jgi:hypothetical protein
VAKKPVSTSTVINKYHDDYTNPTRVSVMIIQRKWQHSQGAQDEVKQNKNTTQYVLDTTMRKQTQIT